jgi:hypothetical protein
MIAIRTSIEKAVEMKESHAGSGVEREIMRGALAYE